MTLTTALVLTGRVGDASARAALIPAPPSSPPRDAGPSAGALSVSPPGTVASKHRNLESSSRRSALSDEGKDVEGGHRITREHE